jgi:hypothetical protein
VGCKPQKCWVSGASNENPPLSATKSLISQYFRKGFELSDHVAGFCGLCGAAMKVIGVEERQLWGQWLNNRAEISLQPFRRRKRAMAKFRDVNTLQKFATVLASIHNHFNHDRHLNCRDIFKENRAAAIAEW